MAGDLSFALNLLILLACVTAEDFAPLCGKYSIMDEPDILESCWSKPATMKPDLIPIWCSTSSRDGQLETVQLWKSKSWTEKPHDVLVEYSDTSVIIQYDEFSYSSEFKFTCNSCSNGVGNTATSCSKHQTEKLNVPSLTLRPPAPADQCLLNFDNEKQQLVLLIFNRYLTSDQLAEWYHSIPDEDYLTDIHNSFVLNSFDTHELVIKSCGSYLNGLRVNEDSGKLGCEFYLRHNVSDLRNLTLPLQLIWNGHIDKAGYSISRTLRASSATQFNALLCHLPKPIAEIKPANDQQANTCVTQDAATTIGWRYQPTYTPENSTYALQTLYNLDLQYNYSVNCKLSASTSANANPTFQWNAISVRNQPTNLVLPKDRSSNVTCTVHARVTLSTRNQSSHVHVFSEPIIVSPAPTRVQQTPVARAYRYSYVNDTHRYVLLWLEGIDANFVVGSPRLVVRVYTDSGSDRDRNRNRNSSRNRNRSSDANYMWLPTPHEQAYVSLHDVQLEQKQMELPLGLLQRRRSYLVRLSVLNQCGDNVNDTQLSTLFLDAGNVLEQNASTKRERTETQAATDSDNAQYQDADENEDEDEDQNQDYVQESNALSLSDEICGLQNYVKWWTVSTGNGVVARVDFRHLVRSLSKRTTVAQAGAEKEASGSTSPSSIHGCVYVDLVFGVSNTTLTRAGTSAANVESKSKSTVPVMFDVARLRLEVNSSGELRTPTLDVPLNALNAKARDADVLLSVAVSVSVSTPSTTDFECNKLDKHQHKHKHEHEHEHERDEPMRTSAVQAAATNLADISQIDIKNKAESHSIRVASVALQAATHVASCTYVCIDVADEWTMTSMRKALYLSRVEALEGAVEFSFNGLHCGSRHCAASGSALGSFSESGSGFGSGSRSTKRVWIDRLRFVDASEHSASVTDYTRTTQHGHDHEHNYEYEYEYVRLQVQTSSNKTVYIRNTSSTTSTSESSKRSAEFGAVDSLNNVVGVGVGVAWFEVKHDEPTKVRLDGLVGGEERCWCIYAEAGGKTVSECEYRCATPLVYDVSQHTSFRVFHGLVFALIICLVLFLGVVVYYFFSFSFRLKRRHVLPRSVFARTTCTEYPEVDQCTFGDFSHELDWNCVETAAVNRERFIRNIRMKEVLVVSSDAHYDSNIPGANLSSDVDNRGYTVGTELRSEVESHSFDQTYTEQSFEPGYSENCKSSFSGLSISSEQRRMAEEVVQLLGGNISASTSDGANQYGSQVLDEILDCQVDILLASLPPDAAGKQRDFSDSLDGAATSHKAAV